MPATSGSFVRGNYSGRAFNTYQAIQNVGVADSSSYFPMVSIRNDGAVDSSSVEPINVRDRTGEVGSIGYLQGLAFGAPTSLDGQGSFGRHMQVGVNQDNTVGNPAAPSLRLDIPGFWRFRWTVPLGSHTVSVSTMQNSTGSTNRPSMIVKANSVLGLNTDVAASASYVAGWTTIGPIAFSVTSSGVIWVELHNNNFGVPNFYGDVKATPAYFDHIVVK